MAQRHALHRADRQNRCHPTRHRRPRTADAETVAALSARPASRKLLICKELDLDVVSFLYSNNNFTYIYIDKPYDSRVEAGDRLINLLRIPEFKNSKAWILKVGKL